MNDKKQITLDKNFFTGGNATFTVENNKGEHYTFKIRRPKNGPVYYFVSLLRGPNNESDYSYLGVLNPLNGEVRLTPKSRMTDYSKPVLVVRWALKHVFGDGLIPTDYNIHHEGKCGCCGRMLTVPESIRNGIGPECIKRFQ